MEGRTNEIGLLIREWGASAFIPAFCCSWKKPLEYGRLRAANSASAIHFDLRYVPRCTPYFFPRSALHNHTIANTPDIRAVLSCTDVFRALLRHRGSKRCSALPPHSAAKTQSQRAVDQGGSYTQ